MRYRRPRRQRDIRSSQRRRASPPADLAAPPMARGPNPRAESPSRSALEYSSGELPLIAVQLIKMRGMSDKSLIITRIMHNTLSAFYYSKIRYFANRKSASYYFAMHKSFPRTGPPFLPENELRHDYTGTIDKSASISMSLRRRLYRHQSALNQFSFFVSRTIYKRISFSRFVS